ncbi:hypothetical protein QBC34DRAFT_477420 [Podospora aff. communis PSN243]|uniref:Uncharacterized protein n=1 Tax=Podospora aff. communis PSN243 TaxID=3040156 RepID=A0AAV9H230_9PEZI|nr:hypothetical protein QBC34DRAFT_477420 [Podospora aff. communis PSN243]
MGGITEDMSVGGNAAGIRVKRETIIIMSDRTDDDYGVRDGAPSVTIKSGDPDTQVQQYCRPKTFRKLSNASSLISEIFRHPETSEEVLRKQIKRANDRDTSRELIEFLRNTEPPRQNTMPIVESQAPKKKRRISLWGFLKRKGKAQRACEQDVPYLRLPDSAVAGRTTGGFRHIAISIPIEYANLDGVVAPKEQQETVPVVEARNEPTCPPPDRAPVRVLKPVFEKREPIQEPFSPSSMLPLIPPLDNETFASLLTADEELESLSSYSSHRDEFASSGSEDASVGHHTSFAAPSPPLTAQPKGCVSSLFSLTEPHAPKLHRTRRHISDVRPQPPAWEQSTAASIVTGGTEPVAWDATTARGYASPQLVFLESPRQSDQDSLGTDTDTAIHSPRLDLNTEKVHAAVEQSQHEAKDHPERILSPYDPYEPDNFARLHTSTDLHHHRSILSLTPLRNKYACNSHHVDVYLSRREMACPSCLTPVTVVADRTPPPCQLTPEPQQGFVTARESIASFDSFSTPSLHATDDSTIDLTPCEPPTPETYRLPHRSINLRTAPSFELTHSRFPYLYHKNIHPLRHHKSTHNLSLLCRYESLRLQRDHELDAIFTRLESIERNNHRWLEAVAPIFENVTRGLLATQGVYQDERHGVWKRRGDFTPPASIAGEDHECDSFWDLKAEVEQAKENSGYGMGVAVDRMPSRRGDGGLKRDAFGYGPGYGYCGKYGFSYGEGEGTLSDANVSGLETVEPVMRELLSEEDGSGEFSGK